MHRIVNGERVELTPQEEEEILQFQQEQETIRQQNEYKEKRRKEYPSLERQLDILHNDIESFNAVDQRSTWFQEIKRIKEKYPPPSS